MAVITISREYGCPADAIALKVATLMDYRYLNKEIMEYVAALVNQSEEKISLFDEEEHSDMRARISRYFDLDIFKEMLKFDEDVLKKQIDEIKSNESVFDKNVIYDHILDSEIFQKVVQRIILSEAKKDNIIFIGRGSQCILKEFKNTIHFRMVAPLDIRISWVMENEGLRVNRAKDKIVDIDKRRSKFLKYYFGEDINNLYLYHLCINLQDFMIDDTVRLICNLIDIKTS
jgi:cytidylate kinase